MPDESFQILYDHYKDTFSIIEKTIAKRQKSFILAILLVIVSVILTLNPDLVLNIAKEVGKEKLKTDLGLTYFSLNSSLLFIGLWFWVQYFQNVLHVENLYRYINDLEEKLCEKIKTFEISREGKSYLKHYPKIKSLLHYFYTILTPILLIFLSAVKGYHELFLDQAQIPTVIKIFDIFGVVLLILLTCLYLSWIHFGDFKN